MKRCSSINPLTRPKSANEIVPLIRKEQKRGQMLMFFTFAGIVIAVISLLIFFSLRPQFNGTEQKKNENVLIDSDTKEKEEIKSTEVNSDTISSHPDPNNVTNEEKLPVISPDAPSMPSGLKENEGIEVKRQDVEKKEGEPWLVLTSTWLDYQIPKFKDSEDEEIRINWKNLVRKELKDWMEGHTPAVDNIREICLEYVDSVLESYKD